MKAYSQDLRERIVRAVAAGMPKAEAARTFQIALSTVKQYVSRQEKTGSLQAKTSPGRPRLIPREQEPALVAQFRAHRNATIAEHVRLWAAQHPSVSADVIRHTIRRLGWRFKKKQWWPPSGTTPVVPTGSGRTPPSMPAASSSSTRRAPRSP